MGASTLPESLSLERHRDDGHPVENACRRVLVALLVLLLALALVGLFGQRPRSSTAAAAEARLTVEAPTRLRGGLMYEARITIEAVRDLRAATIVLGPGWTESMTINTIEPSPVAESSREGRLALDFGHVGRGERIVAFLQLQVNPTNVGSRAQDVELFDGPRPLAGVRRTVVVFP